MKTYGQAGYYFVDLDALILNMHVFEVTDRRVYSSYGPKIVQNTKFFKRTRSLSDQMFVSEKNIFYKVLISVIRHLKV